MRMAHYFVAATCRLRGRFADAFHIGLLHVIRAILVFVDKGFFGEFGNDNPIRTRAIGHVHIKRLVALVVYTGKGRHNGGVGAIDRNIIAARFLII